jgi:hypothetical protein
MGSGWTVSAQGLATKTGATVADFIAAAAASGKAGAATGSAGVIVGFTSGADSYIFYTGTDATANSDDGLIKLVGLTVTDLDSDGTIGSGGAFTLA